VRGAVSIWPRVAAVALAAVLAGCATSPGLSIEPSPGAMPGAVQTGEASWYGRPHQGHRTASGEIFDMYRLTAAHPSLPFGSRVRVTNLRNGRSVEVRVNDRGPIVAGRIIDLSYAAAQELVAVSDGTIPVRIRVLSIPR
jgi:rare lipoprotein A